VLVLDKMIEYFLDDLGIVFYTNMVKYPNVLSVQTMPNELKELAISRLEAVKVKVPNFKYVKQHSILLNLTLQQIDGVINFIRSKDESHLWPDTIEFNRRLDNSRDSRKFVEVTPEFQLYV
jgi:hypothetical protein